MMKNKNGTIILSIILVVQFILPLSIWSYETYKNKELDEKGQEVKLLIDYVRVDEGKVEFEKFTLREALFNDETKYIAFENNGEDFSTVIETKNKPETDIYVSSKRLYSWYRPNWCFEYESEITRAQDEYDYFELYNCEVEKENIEQGYSKEPQTKAYAIFKVYKNRFKVVNVYIEEMPVDTVIEKYKNNEWDNSRYEYQYDDYDEIVKEIYDAVIEGYVTEPVAA